MNRIIFLALSVSVFLSVASVPADAQSFASPAVTGPIVKNVSSRSSCQSEYGWIYTKYNGIRSCIRCDERNGWRYAKFNGKDSCVLCDEKNGWRYDGNQSCVKK